VGPFEVGAQGSAGFGVEAHEGPADHQPVIVAVELPLGVVERDPGFAGGAVGLQPGEDFAFAVRE